MILVTGATGFIGEQLVRALLERQEQVRLFVRSRQKAEAIYGPLFEQMEVAEGNLLDEDSLPAAVQGIDRVYHLASWISFQASYRAMHRVNVSGTRNLMEACQRAGVRRLLHVSSIAAGGPAVVTADGELRPRTEADPPQPLPDAYGRTKREQEELVLSYLEQGMEVVVVRPAAVYGPGDPEGINTLLWMVKNGKLPFYLGDPQVCVNLVFIKDLIRGIISAMERGRSGEIYNLVGANATQGDLLKLIAHVSDSEPPHHTMPLSVLMAAARLAGITAKLLRKERALVHPHDIRNWTASWMVSGEKAREELGMTTTDLAGAIRETLTWLDRHKTTYSAVAASRRSGGGVS